MYPIFIVDPLRCHPSPPKFGERVPLPPTRDFLSFPEYEVKAIIGLRRYLGRLTEYGPAAT